MATASHRRDALRALIKNQYDGVARRLALAAKKPEGQINDMLSDPPRKPFGEKIARQLESKLGLIDGYFDQQTADEQINKEPSRAMEKAAIYGFEATAIRQVANIMIELDSDRQQQLIGAAKHLLNEQRLTAQNSTKRAGQ